MTRNPDTLLKVTMILYIIAGVVGFLLALSDAFAGVVALMGNASVFGYIILSVAAIAAITAVLMVIVGVRSLQESYRLGNALTGFFIVSGIVQFVALLCAQQIDVSLLFALVTVVLPLLFRAGIRKS